MSLKLKKLAVATAAAISLGAAGQAQSSDLLFPYVVVGDTVTTLVSVINTNVYRPGDTQQLHYTLLSKSGDAAGNNAATCDKTNVFRSTSANDIQTIDLGDRLANNLGVMFRDMSVRNNWVGAGQSFALASNIGVPLRGFLVVDDVSGPLAANRGRADSASRQDDGFGGGEFVNNDLYGEAFVVEFASGAVWGYQASNAWSGPNRLGDHRDPNAGVAMGLRATGDDHRWVYPVALMPDDQVTTRFFVTPLVNDMRNDGVVNRSWARLRLGPIGGTDGPAVYDRDENPVSGTNTFDVRCVGAVNALTTDRGPGLVTRGAMADFERNGADVGWAYLSVFGRTGATENTPAANAAPNSTEVSASIIKLEFNSGSSSFGGRQMGVFNNAFQITDSRLTSRASTLGNRQIGRTQSFAVQGVDVIPEYPAGAVFTVGNQVFRRDANSEFATFAS